MVKRCVNPEAQPMSELESLRRDTAAVRARVVADPTPVGHTPLTVDVAAMQAWLLRLVEESALPRSPWVGWVD